MAARDPRHHPHREHADGARGERMQRRGRCEQAEFGNAAECCAQHQPCIADVQHPKHRYRKDPSLEPAGHTHRLAAGKRQPQQPGRHTGRRRDGLRDHQQHQQHHGQALDPGALCRLEAGQHVLGEERHHPSCHQRNDQQDQVEHDPTHVTQAAHHIEQLQV